MKAVFLLAGKSTRTYPLTVNRSKYTLTVLGKTILQHNLEQISPLVSEFIFVISKDDKRPFGDEFNGKKISYMVQQKALGTANALLAAKDQLKEKFLLLMGDDLYSRNDIKKCLKYENCALVKKVDNPELFGVFSVKDSKAVDLEEKPAKPKSSFANTGAYVLSPKIIEHAGRLKKSRRGEFELTDAIKELIKNSELYISEVDEYWLPITYPWSLIIANNFFLDRMPESNKGKMEKNVTIKGKVHIGENSIIKSGTYIEGPVFIGDNCEIGPNAYLRSYSVIENGCKAGNCVEVKNSIIMENTKASHLIYIGDSVIGRDCNIAAGTITANLRHDGTEIRSMINRKLIGSGRRKLGAIIGDGVKTAINTTIYEGRKIWPGKMTKPGEIVKVDIN